MATKKRVSLVHLAAKLYGCAVEELLSYREHEDGSVVIIAPSGQKFTYSAESIMQFVLKEAEVSHPIRIRNEGGESPPTPLVNGGAEAPLSLFEDGGTVIAQVEPVLTSDRASQATRTVRGAAKKSRKPSATGKSGG